jgi:hypothetical protein
MTGLTLHSLMTMTIHFIYLFIIGGKRIFPLASVSRPALGPTQPPVHVYWGSFPGARVRPGCDADHSPPSSAEVVNE